jgi:maleamate amidohydrolase
MAINNDEAADWRGKSVGQLLDGLGEKRRLFSRMEPGRSVALVVVDMQNFFLRDGDAVSDAALMANRRLLERARAASIPVFLVRNVFDRREEINPFWMSRRNGRAFLMRDDPKSELHDRLGRIDSDVVVDKKHVSGFTGTTLQDHLSARGVDTLLLTGTATSVCVRATAVEGAARHYRVLVVEECTYDPHSFAGPYALYEIADRYADVIAFDEALEILNRFETAKP